MRKSGCMMHDAEYLIAAGHVGAAYYIGGHAIELALKAIACKKLDIDIFDKEVVPKHIARFFMIHDLADLVILAGMASEVQNECLQNPMFQLSWSRVSDWSEQRRYDLPGRPETAEVFVISLKIVLLWLKKHW